MLDCERYVVQDFVPGPDPLPDCAHIDTHRPHSTIVAGSPACRRAGWARDAPILET
jgi:hypothetical protein